MVMVMVYVTPSTAVTYTLCWTHVGSSIIINRAMKSEDRFTESSCLKTASC